MAWTPKKAVIQRFSSPTGPIISADKFYSNLQNFSLVGFKISKDVIYYMWHEMVFYTLSLSPQFTHFSVLVQTEYPDWIAICAAFDKQTKGNCQPLPSHFKGQTSE